MITLSGGPFGGLEINTDKNINDIIEHENCYYKIISENFAVFIGYIS